MGKLLYFVKEAVRGLYQAKLMTSVSILAIAVALFLLGIAAVAVYNVQVWFERVSAQVDIVAYLADSTSADSAQVRSICDRIRQSPQVDSVLFVGKAQASARFAAQYGSDMLQAVDDNPLPASVEISLAGGRRTAADVEQVRNLVQGMTGVEAADYSKEWFVKLERFRRYLLLGVAGAAVICLLVLHFIVSNTIKLTIYARKELVLNMRYVGATDRYIETPFILEGVLQGIAGAGAASAAILIVKTVAARYALQWGPHQLLAALWLTGLIFGWLGSASAVRKFLK